MIATKAHMDITIMYEKGPDKIVTAHAMCRASPKLETHDTENRAIGKANASIMPDILAGFPLDNDLFESFISPCWRMESPIIVIKNPMIKSMCSVYLIE
jgi:hypothetical protein